MTKKFIKSILIVLVFEFMFTNIVFAQNINKVEGNTPSGVKISDIEKKTDNIAKKYIGKDVPGAAVTIVKNGEIVFSKGYGYADIEKKEKIDPSKTYMEAGSVSKLYTWTAVMQLVESGKLDLDKDIREYLPENFIKLKFEEPVTLKHLMSHTAGFEESPEKMFEMNSKDILSLKEYISKYQPKQIYRPGEIIAYSNYGTNLAGYIVERVSGVSFEEYINTNIFGPLNMNKATFSRNYDNQKEIISNKASGYSKVGEELVKKPNFFINDMPAGSLNLTSEDMANFMIAHLNEEGNNKYNLFKKNDTLKNMHSVLFTHNKSLSGNAHGFWERTSGGYRVIEHGGNTMSFTASFSLVPSENFGVYVMTNVESDMSGFSRDIVNELVGSSFSNPKADPNLKNAKNVEGIYRSARNIETSFGKLIPIISNGDKVITSNEDGSINLKIAAYDIDIKYVETKPYLFERVTKEDSILDKAGMDTSKMFFKTDDKGKVTMLTVGTIGDDLPISFTQTSGFILVIFVLSIVVFLGTFIFFLIRWIVRKVKKKDNRGFNLERSVFINSFIGMLMMINSIYIIIVYLSDYNQPISNFNGNVINLWVMTIAYIISTIFSIRKWKNEDSKLTSKILLIIFTITFIIITILLYSFNFYSLS